SEACYSTPGSNYSSLCPGSVEQSTALGSGMPCSIDGCEHGTHVAGIAAGNGTSLSGVAKNATIVAIQVFSQDNNLFDCPKDSASPCIKAKDRDVINGLERVHELALTGAFKIAAVNLSLGSGKYSSNCDLQNSDYK